MERHAQRYGDFSGQVDLGSLKRDAIACRIGVGLQLIGQNAFDLRLLEGVFRQERMAARHALNAVAQLTFVVFET